MAREENEGNIDLIDHTLRQAVPDSQKAAYGPAADKAIAALKDFNAFLKDTLSKKTSDWRLGKEKYARKFEYVLAAGKQPEQLLAEAALAPRLRFESAPGPFPIVADALRLDEIARQHATPAAYWPQPRRRWSRQRRSLKKKGCSRCRRDRISR